MGRQRALAKGCRLSSGLSVRRTPAGTLSRQLCSPGGKSQNAIFGTLAFPQLLWLATGNKGMLKREALLPLRGRDVIVIPDCDAVEEWTRIVEGLPDLANFTVSDFCRRQAPEGQPKFDIADYLQQQLWAQPF